MQTPPAATKDGVAPATAIDTASVGAIIICDIEARVGNGIRCQLARVVANPVQDRRNCTVMLGTAALETGQPSAIPHPHTKQDCTKPTSPASQATEASRAEARRGAPNRPMVKATKSSPPPRVPADSLNTTPLRRRKTGSCSTDQRSQANSKHQGAQAPRRRCTTITNRTDRSHGPSIGSRFPDGDANVNRVAYANGGYTFATRRSSC